MDGLLLWGQMSSRSAFGVRGVVQYRSSSDMESWRQRIETWIKISKTTWASSIASNPCFEIARPMHFICLSNPVHHSATTMLFQSWGWPLGKTEAFLAFFYCITGRNNFVVLELLKFLCNATKHDYGSSGGKAVSPQSKLLIPKYNDAIIYT